MPKKNADPKPKDLSLQFESYAFMNIHPGWLQGKVSPEVGLTLVKLGGEKTFSGEFENIR